MFHAVLSVIGFALVWSVISMGKTNKTAVVDDQSIEVFRAEHDVAHAALDMLCDGGVPAWIERCADSQEHLAVHVEESDVELVKAVLAESGIQRA